MIVITAPTGNIGHQVVENVLGSGEAIRVIARDPSRLPAQVLDRAEVVDGIARRHRRGHQGVRGR